MREKYKEKPKEVEARLFDGDQQALADVVAWIQEAGYVWFDMFTAAPSPGVSIDPSSGALILVNNKGELGRVQKGYWVIKQPNGVLEPMSNEEFLSTYEKIAPSPIVVDPTHKVEAPVDPAQLPPTIESGVHD